MHARTYTHTHTHTHTHMSIVCKIRFIKYFVIMLNKIFLLKIHAVNITTNIRSNRYVESKYYLIVSYQLLYII